MSKQVRIPYRSAPQAMQQTWDRMDKLGRSAYNPHTLFDTERHDQVVAAYEEARTHYRKVSRKHGYIPKGRNMPAPILVKVLPLRPGMVCVPKGREQWEAALRHPMIALNFHDGWEGLDKHACIVFEPLLYASIRTPPPGFNLKEIPFEQFIERLTPDPTT